MLLFNIPVATANAIYSVSLIALLVSAGLMVISAIALAWSGSIRDRVTNQELANLNTTSAAANAEVLKAKAQVATANQEIAQANAAAVQAEKDAANAKQSAGPKPEIGREISAESCGLFINYVKTVSKGRITVQAIASNTEATHYAQQLSDMLKDAGYDVQQTFGSATLLGEPPIGVQMKIRSMEEQPPYAGSLQKGLEFIGINTSGTLDATAGDFVMIFVGTKP